MNNDERLHKGQQARRTQRAKWETYISPWGTHKTDLPDSAEEYEVLAKEHNKLDEMFDEPDRPIGVFDQVEVDHHVELERQRLLKDWRDVDATKDELEEFQQSTFGRSSQELDNTAQSARESLFASRKLISNAAPRVPRQSPASQDQEEEMRLDRRWLCRLRANAP